MTTTVTILVTVLALWMLICGWCGYGKRFGTFVLVLLAGLALNAVWMAFGLGAHPFEPHALMAQFSAALYGLCAFGCGWLAGRVARQWQDSRVEDADRSL